MVSVSALSAGERFSVPEGLFDESVIGSAGNPATQSDGIENNESLSFRKVFRDE